MDEERGVFRSRALGLVRGVPRMRHARSVGDLTGAFCLFRPSSKNRAAPRDYKVRVLIHTVTSHGANLSRMKLDLVQHEMDDTKLWSRAGKSRESLNMQCLRGNSDYALFAVTFVGSF